MNSSAINPNMFAIFTSNVLNFHSNPLYINVYILYING